MTRLSTCLTLALGLTATWAVLDTANASACSPPRPGEVRFVGVSDGDVVSDEPGIVAWISAPGKEQYTGFTLTVGKALVPVEVTSLGGGFFGQYVVVSPKAALVATQEYTLSYAYVPRGGLPPVGQGGAVSFKVDDTLQGPAMSKLEGMISGRIYKPAAAEDLPGQNSCQSGPPIEEVKLTVSSARAVKDVDLLRMRVLDKQGNQIAVDYHEKFQTSLPPAVGSFARFDVQVEGDGQPKVFPYGDYAECVEIQGFQTSHGLVTAAKVVCKSDTAIVNCPDPGIGAASPDECYQASFAISGDGGGGTNTSTSTSTSTGTSTSTSTGTSTVASNTVATANTTGTTAGTATSDVVTVIPGTATSGGSATATNGGSSTGDGGNTSGGGVVVTGGGGGDDGGCTTAAQGQGPAPVGWMMVIAGALLGLGHRRKKRQC